MPSVKYLDVFRDRREVFAMALDGLKTGVQIIPWHNADRVSTQDINLDPQGDQIKLLKNMGVTSVLEKEDASGYRIQPDLAAPRALQTSIDDI